MPITTTVPKLVFIEFLGDYVIRGTLTDGRVRDLDFGEELRGPLLEPLRDPENFRAARIDETGTLTWPNGADVAPEAWVRGWPED